MLEPTTIAALLRELAVYYELDGDRHRAFAYERASKSVEAAGGLHRLIEEGRLEELPGIGPSIARVAADLARTGTVPVLERQRAQWPPVVIELAQLPRVGVPKARRIFQSLGPADLEYAIVPAKQRRIREAARLFLARRPDLAGRRARFDVVLLGGDPLRVRHLEDAFTE